VHIDLPAAAICENERVRWILLRDLEAVFCESVDEPTAIFHVDH